MEILLVPLSLFAWMLGWCAPITGVILVQALRIKYLGSNFTRKAMVGIDRWLQANLPGFVYDTVCSPVKNFLSNMAGVKEALKNENEATKQMKDGNSQQKRPANSNLSTVDEDLEEEDDEPKTFEVFDSDDDGAKAKPGPKKRREAKTYEVTPDDLD